MVFIYNVINGKQIHGQYQTVLLFFVRMKNVYSLLLMLLVATAAHAQNFPLDFVGHWKGEIAWYQQGKSEPRKFAMQLRILPTDTAGHYTWQIIYGDKETDNRPYVLKPVDTAKGHWMVDEQNGIILDQYWAGGKLHGVFSVGGSLIFNTYWLEKGALQVEFTSMPATPQARTGYGTEESPHVDSYNVKSVQRGTLVKVKTSEPLPLRKPK